MGYHITCFRDFPETVAGPLLLLRHDLDHSIRSAAVIAEIEAELRITATYFVQVACDFYNLLSTESRLLLARIAALGHEVGLHYDARRYLGEGGAVRLRLELALLEELTGQPVRSASQHIPIASPALDIRDFVAHDAYEPRFTAAPMTYISDSLMAWRQATPHELLDQGRSFQLLTHPMKWARPVTSMTEALQLAEEEEVAALRARYGEVGEQYRQLLQDRARLDSAFAARQPHAPT